MISEEQQDQATLYALGLLQADEADQIERAMDADLELRNFVRGLREAAATIAHGAPVATPPPALRARVLRDIAAGEQPTPAGNRPPDNVVPFRLPGWVPWALAASLLALCGYLGSEQVRLRRELADVRPTDPLAKLTLFTLAASDKGPPAARASVAWEPAGQHGILRLTGLPVPESGKDYQLWAIGGGGQGPVSAGVVHVDAKGAAQIEFHPVAAVGQVAAFAVSLERTGGSAGNPEGPILLAPGGS